jgi:SAM-dependent methyltransferase
MTDPRIDDNLKVYNSASTAAHYAALSYVTPCERLLFEAYILPGAAVLDLGVGGGRTTACLASQSTRYVGVDNAPAMVESCRRKFPDLEFVVADAADLSAFPKSSFDAVVFAFNGIDFVLPRESRTRCLDHIERILKPGGVVILSSHNARAVFVRPSWNRERLVRIARRYSLNSNVILKFWMALLTSIRATLAFFRAAGLTLSRIIRRLPQTMFWKGDGTLLDSAHGGLFTHYSIPKLVVAEFNAVHLESERILGDDYPRTSHPLVTDWYYYVFTKPRQK